ncbi:hypothetical protein L211DRAFT_842330 [Terfezia boudieri ATCC MYA-4762]|uniref:Fungal-type protein kinase domain-containing protein n=1 Tax=Terfezia boudieri ATCC MYA-4762 TaxID=1051890 RepID=A0A3N4LAA8_9PEZI|nr:hypothetical protein L211DRAFT_842330 [Terfezia boudieri ATCC MYA-4762]
MSTTDRDSYNGIISGGFQSRQPKSPRAGAPSSAPANYYYPPHSTPVKRKASSIPLPGPNIQRRSASNGTKRLRSAATTSALLQGELSPDSIYRDPRFVETFFLNHTSAFPSHDEAVDILADLTRQNIGVMFDTKTGVYSCLPRGFSDGIFVNWFCEFASGITRSAKRLAMDQQRCSFSPTTRPGSFVWISARTLAPAGLHNRNLRPDITLTIEEAVEDALVPPQPSGRNSWRGILVAGEHQSAGSTVQHAQTQLATYAQEVFVAQPFRSSLFGFLSSNKKPSITFWHFDRAGAVCSKVLDYTSSEKDLVTVVRALAAFSSLTPQQHGFHTASIEWSQNHVYPLDEACHLSTQLNCASFQQTKERIALQKPIFIAAGIVGRGTRVWKCTPLSSPSDVLAVKYSWRSTGRVSEGDLYLLAAEKGVIGLPTVIASDSYEDIERDVRHGLVPDPADPPMSNIDSAPDTTIRQYETYMASHNRILSRLIFSTTGTPIDHPSLTPLCIARALYSGLIAHASLLFEGGILHRDISTNNILAYPDPTNAIRIIPGKSKVCPDGDMLFGCLIDLDYAINIGGVSAATASGAADRTGTYPFIAINILLGTDGHRYRHDLESMFYVLLWVACNHALPHTHSASSAKDQQRKEGRYNVPTAMVWPEGNPLEPWLLGNPREVASHKLLNIVSYEAYFEQLLERFAEGFAPFEQAAYDFRSVLWESGQSGNFMVPQEVVPDEGSGRVGKQGRIGSRRRGNSNAVGKEEIKPGLSDWQGFLQVKAIFERLVAELEKNEQELEG